MFERWIRDVQAAMILDISGFPQTRQPNGFDRLQPHKVDHPKNLFFFHINI